MIASTSIFFSSLPNKVTKMLASSSSSFSVVVEAFTFQQQTHQFISRYYFNNKCNNIIYNNKRTKIGENVNGLKLVVGSQKISLITCNF